MATPNPLLHPTSRVLGLLTVFLSLLTTTSSADAVVKSNGSYSSANSIAVVVLAIVGGLLEIVGAVLILSYIVKKQNQRPMVIYILGVVQLADVGVLLLVCDQVNPRQQRCSGENAVLMATAAVAFLVFVVVAEWLVSDNNKEQHQRSGWINTLLMVIAALAGLVFMGVIVWLLIVV